MPPDGVIPTDVVDDLDRLARTVITAAGIAAGTMADPLDLISTGPALDAGTVAELRTDVREAQGKYTEFRSAKESAMVTGNIAMELLDVIKKLVPLLGLAAL